MLVDTVLPHKRIYIKTRLMEMFGLLASALDPPPGSNFLGSQVWVIIFSFARTVRNRCTVNLMIGHGIDSQVLSLINYIEKE